MATFVQAVNKVLQRLRESTVTDYNDTDYSTLISIFVNDAKREVEDSWDWTALRTTITVTTSASDYDYTLTGAGDRFTILNVYNDSTNQKYFLNQMNYKQMKLLLGLDNTDSSAPVRYAFEGENASNDPTVLMWPVPDGIYSIDFNIVLPQADLSSSSTVIKVPEYPVILGAYAKALEERGEDMGITAQSAWADYNKALAYAILQDAAKVPDETDWYVM